MVHMSEVFDLKEFVRLHEEGYIFIGKHPSKALCIANYTQKAQYEGVWTPETINSRGLIFDDELNVVARGFPKFFNYNEGRQQVPASGGFILSPKMDGSLAIQYGARNIATRGSFKSDQALEATKMLREAGGRKLIDGVTPVFEIIYPENRIVVDYGDDRKLVLLDVINHHDGSSNQDVFDSFDWPDKVSRTVRSDYSEDILTEIPEGEEGFVMYWPSDNVRLKMKSEDYIRLHRIVTGISVKSIWEMIRDGKTKNDILEMLPDELFEWATKEIDELLFRANAIVDEASEFYSEINREVPDNGDDRARRAEFAKRVTSVVPKNLQSIVFSIFSKGYVREELMKIAWKQLRPEGDTRKWG